MLDARVVLKAIKRQVFAVSGMFKPTVRHLCHEGNVAVNPHCAKVQTFSKAHCPPMIFGPHTGGQTIKDIVS